MWFTRMLSFACSGDWTCLEKDDALEGKYSAVQQQMDEEIEFKFSDAWQTMWKLENDDDGWKDCGSNKNVTLQTRKPRSGPHTSIPIMRAWATFTNIPRAVVQQAFAIRSTWDEGQYSQLPAYDEKTLAFYTCFPGMGAVQPRDFVDLRREEEGKDYQARVYIDATVLIEAPKPGRKVTRGVTIACGEILRDHGAEGCRVFVLRHYDLKLNTMLQGITNSQGPSRTIEWFTLLRKVCKRLMQPGLPPPVSEPAAEQPEESLPIEVEHMSKKADGGSKYDSLL